MLHLLVERVGLREPPQVLIDTDSIISRPKIQFKNHCYQNCRLFTVNVTEGLY